MKLAAKVLLVLALMAATAAVTFCVTVSEYDSAQAEESPAAAKVEEIRRYLASYFIDDYDEAEVLSAANTAMGDAAARAMIEATGDEWSYYVSAAEYQNFHEQNENAYVGVGVTIMRDEAGFAVTKVTPGGPAERAGVQVSDVLIEVEGESVLELGQEETVARVRGEAGSEVAMTFLRDGARIELTLVRSNIETEVAALSWFGSVAYITIANFDTHAAEQTLGAVEEALSKDASALVFDVRNDPGGYKTELVEILDRLLPEGPIFQSRDYTGKEETDQSDATCVDLPMAVLVNEETYSAAEYFTAALQEYGAATIVGVQTYGKGNFQWEIPLSDGSAISLSVGKYFTPHGRSLTGNGVTPDVVVDLSDEQFEQLYYGSLPPEEDPQLQAALEAVREETLDSGERSDYNAQ